MRKFEVTIGSKNGQKGSQITFKHKQDFNTKENLDSKENLDTYIGKLGQIHWKTWT